jgi:2-oxoglutarate ferredoxin oxidoreductase subunit alpha
VIINVQRGGPSTGLPTKTEQADLLQVMYGRNGESPAAVVAPATPSECFAMIQEAFRLAVGYMTPVFFLSDGYLANGAEPWLIPSIDLLPRIEIKHPKPATNGASDGFMPYKRDARHVRPWAIPGTRGLEHRIGGLEKQDVTGNVSYDPDNHQNMVKHRAAKIAGIADDIPLLEVDGADSADLLVVGWGSTYGAIATAVHRAQKQGKSVAHAHLRYLNPMPRNTAEVLRSYRKILVPELNMGQLSTLLRSRFLLDVTGLNKVKGKPFLVSELSQKIDELLQP